MNKFLGQALLMLSLSVGLVGAAWSYVIDDSNAGINNGTDIGALDLILGQDDKKNGIAAEINWVNGILGSSYDESDTVKTEDVAYYSTNSEGVFAFELANGPGYYLIKNARRTALFENVNNYSWGVIDVSQLIGRWNIKDDDDMEISHVTEFGETPQNVSEPGSIALLGLGLIGLAVTRRKLAA